MEAGGNVHLDHFQFRGGPHVVDGEYGNFYYSILYVDTENFTGSSLLIEDLLVSEYVSSIPGCA